MKQISKETIEKLDLTYLVGMVYQKWESSVIYSVCKQTSKENLLIKDPLIIGAVFADNPENNHFPSPVLSEGVPRVRDNLNSKYYIGLHAGPIRDNVFYVRYDWASEIGVQDTGRTNVYVGQGIDYDAVLFEEPLQFDPSKKLFFARSPNGSLEFKDSLHTMQAKEVEGLELQDYSLVYRNLEELKKGLSWARNMVYGTGIAEKINTHLIEKLKEE